jgi:anti-anti-sigma factor
MNLETMVIGNVHVLTPVKNLVGGEETELLKVTVANLTAAGSAKIVVDLGKISWLSSLGISGLIRARADCVARDGWLRLARADKRIDHIILIGRLSALFDSFESVENAVNAPVKNVEPKQPAQ